MLILKIQVSLGLVLSIKGYHPEKIYLIVRKGEIPLSSHRILMKITSSD